MKRLFTNAVLLFKLASFASAGCLADTYNFKLKKKAVETKKVEKAPVEKADAPPAIPVAVPEPVIPTTVIAAPTLRRSWFRMGFAACYLNFNTYDSYNSVTGPNYYNVSSYGGEVNLNVSFSTLFGISTFLGVGQRSRASKDGSRSVTLMGIEIEVNPFATDSVIYSPVEFNFLAGVSGTTASLGEPHAGARLTLNVNQRFGISALTRLSPGLQLLNVGVVTRL